MYRLLKSKLRKEIFHYGNDTHIQFEICEDALTDAAYFNACYQEACEMTAYLCKMFGIDPKGTISYNGLQVPTIIDHTGSHALGLGSNHGDVQHWSRRYGKTMENVRNDVAAILAADGATPTPPSVPAETEDNAKTIWDRLYAVIQNPYGVAGVMGNFMAESSLRANNLQNSYLLPGDILLNDGHHTATNVTVGSKVKGEWKPGATITPVAPPEPAPVVTKYYRVRKSWAEKSSQIGAFTVFQNAKNCVDANPGYAAFDDNGNQVYPAVKQTFEPYLVKVSIDDLNYRKGPSTSYASWGYIPVGVYTIVDEQDGWGLLKAYADKRNGWISLAYAKKL